LKLEGAAVQSYSHGFAADASPTFAAVAAHLSKDFIKPGRCAVERVLQVPARTGQFWQGGQASCCTTPVRGAWMMAFHWTT
jgi:hypothetical protein